MGADPQQRHVAFRDLVGRCDDRASFLATTLFDYFDGTQPTLERAGVRIAIFALFGLASGLALWFITENRYRKGA